MLLGCIADDFTGAGDLGNVLTRAGMHTIQFVGTPTAEAPPCDAGIVSLKSRSIDPDLAVKQSLDALSWLQAQGCEQFLFKHCSTFDSTPQGNIGPVAEALLKATGSSSAVVCPAFPTLNRSVYRGHLFVGDRLLSESGMEAHPLTPMTDANLVRWLGRQTSLPVGLISAGTIMEGAGAVRTCIDRLSGDGPILIVCDCITDDDLIAIGEAAAEMPFVTGGSGIGAGLARNFRPRCQYSGLWDGAAMPAGKFVVLAGSCSAATRAQIEVHRKDNPTLRLDADAVLAGETNAGDVANWAAGHDETMVPLIYSSEDPIAARATQDRLGSAIVASKLEHFFSLLALRLRHLGTRRFVVAGGETASAVVSAFGIARMCIGPEIEPGVPLLLAKGPPDLGLVLKSGNFGSPDFFRLAANALRPSR